MHSGTPLNIWARAEYRYYRPFPPDLENGSCAYSPCLARTVQSTSGPTGNAARPMADLGQAHSTVVAAAARSLVRLSRSRRTSNSAASPVGTASDRTTRGSSSAGHRTEESDDFW